MNFSSKLIEQAVEAFASLPGIGKKTAVRLALHLVDQPNEYAEQFTQALSEMKINLKTCKTCFNLSDDDTCTICSDKSRNPELLCVVESIRDLMAIEHTGHYRGYYHILGGVISPLEGIGPSDLNIDQLITRIESKIFKEVIMAISPTIEGDTTIFFVSKQLSNFDVRISTISRGVAFGGELEYADGLTLGRSIASRIPYQVTLGA